MKRIFGAVLLASAAWLMPAAPEAHRTVVSKFTFHQDVQPVLARRCVGCHAAGGLAPMPLSSFDEVRAQTWPIRQALLARSMPPWFADSGRAAIREQQSLTTRELDLLMTWASGGAPEGTAGIAAPSVAKAGATPATAPAAPEVSLTLPGPFVLAAGAASVEHVVTLPSAAVRGRWIRAAAVEPGTPAMLRSATVGIRSGSGHQVVSLWIPGDAPQPLAGDGAFFVPRESVLTLRLHYVRPAGAAGVLTDRSAVQLWLAPRGARPVRSLEVAATNPPLDRVIQALALRPLDGPALATVRVMVVSAAGERTTLMRYQHRPDWPRRYTFEIPVAITRGSRIELQVAPWPGDLWRSLLGSPHGTGSSTVTAALDVIE